MLSIIILIVFLILAVAITWLFSEEHFTHPSDLKWAYDNAARNATPSPLRDGVEQKRSVRAKLAGTLAATGAFLYGPWRFFWWFLLWGALAILAGLLLTLTLYGLGKVFGWYTLSEQKYAPVELVAMNMGNETSGEFFLFVGSSGSESTVKYMYEASDGSLRYDDWSAYDSRIFEHADGEDGWDGTPTAQRVGYVYEMDWLLTGGIESSGGYTTYHVPEGTVVRELTVDLGD